MVSRSVDCRDVSSPTLPRPTVVDPYPLVDDVTVTGVTHDSRAVQPGDLYAALPGANTHGARFGADAVAAGAAGILTDGAGREILDEIGVTGVPVLVHDNPRARLGDISAAIYGHPSRELTMIGITGTNGKTTTAYLIEAALRAAGQTTGLIGTVETRIGGDHVSSVRTTPESTDLHALLAAMRERGVTACVMEVSSHALVYGRVDGVIFDVAAFTNLSRDHLDFHGTLEDYFAAKGDLFTGARSRVGVIMADDAHGRALAAGAEIPVQTVTTRRDIEITADWMAADGRLTGPDGVDVELTAPMPGDFNVANAALAVVTAVRAGIDPETAAGGVAAAPGVPGRMEAVKATEGSGGVSDAPLALVDYAHTPEAIATVLDALPAPGRRIAVLGAGGDRDRDKRPLMGAAAARHADVVIVTDDNPRSEEPASIRRAVLDGARNADDRRAGDIREIADRRAAIQEAVNLADGVDDVIVVLGKGHEQGQEIAGTVHPFDDREVLGDSLRAALERAAEEKRG